MESPVALLHTVNTCALRQMEYIAYLVSAVAILALSCDWRQTLRGTRWATELFEVNPFLGPQPSVRRVNIYFTSSTILVVGSLAFLMSLEEFGVVTGVAGFVATIELCCVINNWSLGVTLTNNKDKPAFNRRSNQKRP